MIDAANLRLTTTKAGPGSRRASAAGILSLFSALAFGAMGCAPLGGTAVDVPQGDGAVAIGLGAGDAGVGPGGHRDGGNGGRPDSGTGTIGTDAGTVGTDAGTGGTDAGTVGTDAGTVGTDAGTGGTDAGTGGTDAGTGGTDAGTGGTDAGTGGTDAGMGGSQTGASAVLHTSGRYLLDRCNNRLVIRGVEQVLGNQLPSGNDWAGLIDKIAATGSNAVRILPVVTVLSPADVDAVLARVEANGMVAFISPWDRTWFGRSDVKAVLTAHEGSIIIDAFQEPNYDNRTQWVTDVNAAIAQIRSYGYRVPITVLANQYGRDLPVLLSRGAEVIANDPQHNIILGWQAYWGSGGWYQGLYGMTVTQGIVAAAGAAFPIQIGIDDITDANQTMDYGAAMTTAEANDIGWLWWDWYNPYGAENNLTTNGSMSGLNARGTIVVQSHAASIQHTSVKACRP